jgi:purine-binding chemotaxis protein CheW
VIVDSVSDVLNISKSDIQVPPEFDSSMDVRFIDGIAKPGEKIVMLLNIDRILNDADFEMT